MNLAAIVRISLLSAGLCLGAYGQTAKQDIKNAGTDTKNAAKNTAKATKRTAKKTGKKVKQGTHNAAQDVANKTK